MNQTNNNRFIAILYCVALSFFWGMSLFFLDRFPSILYDEPLYADTAYFFSEYGSLSNILGGYSGKQFFLYPFLLSFYMKITEPTLFSLRLFNLVIGSLTLGLFILITNRILKHRLIVVATVACFITSNILFVVHRIVRPEAMLVFFFVAALYFFLRDYGGKMNSKHIVYGGICLSFAMLSHPIGGIYFGLYCFYLIYLFTKKKGNTGFLFFLSIIPLSLIVSLFFLFWSEKSFLETLQVLIFSERIPSKMSIIGGFFYNLKLFYIGYSLEFKRLFLIGLELLVIGWGIYRWKTKQLEGIFAPIALCVLIVGFIVFQPYLRPYYATFTVISILLLGLFFDNYYKNSKLTAVFLVAYALYSFMGNVYILYKSSDEKSSAEIKNKILNLIPVDANIVSANHYFWFWFKHQHTRYDRQIQLTSSDDYVIISPISYIVTQSQSTNEKTLYPYASQSQKQYQDIMDRLLKNHQLVETIQTNRYGKISLFKINSNAL